MASCKREQFIVPDDMKSEALDSLKFSGTRPMLVDPNAVSFSDPVTWGDASGWPIFFITLFFAFEAGSGSGRDLIHPIR